MVPITERLPIQEDKFFQRPETISANSDQIKRLVKLENIQRLQELRRLRESGDFGVYDQSLEFMKIAQFMPKNDLQSDFLL